MSEVSIFNHDSFGVCNDDLVETSTLIVAFAAFLDVNYTCIVGWKPPKISTGVTALHVFDKSNIVSCTDPPFSLQRIFLVSVN